MIDKLDLVKMNNPPQPHVKLNNPIIKLVKLNNPMTCLVKMNNPRLPWGYSSLQDPK